MKTKIALLAGIAALTLAACQNEEVGKEETKEVKQSEKKTEILEDKAKETATKDEKQLTSEQELAPEQEEPKEKVKDEATNNHQHEVSKYELKAEDIIVSYFRAISFSDAKVLEELYPSAVDENLQMEKLFKISKVAADITDMEKISLNNDKAVYKVSVKLYTKEDDNNFTDNKSEYTLTLDLTKGIIETKAISATNYLE